MGPAAGQRRSRWDAKRGWISSDFDDPDTTVVTFLYAPGLGSGKPDGSSLQFRRAVPDDGTPPEAQAAAALHQLAEEDPKTYGQVCGSSPERAAEPGEYHAEWTIDEDIV
ncbi:hypothetical protein ACWIG5_34880 [Streptomyces lydicus]